MELMKTRPVGGRPQAGFTLIELMISMVIFAVAMTAVYTSYLTQQRTYIAQTQVAAMQQNIRAGMYHLERELRMAGYDPNRTADAGFLTANNDGVRFTCDLNSDGDLNAGGANDPNEQVHYELNGLNLGRETWGGGLQPLAENIEVLDFVYLDANRNVLNPALADVSVDNLGSIRSIQVTLVARTGQIDKDFRNNTVYRNKQDVVILPAQNDRYRRRMLSTTIHCRNMGL